MESKRLAWPSFPRIAQSVSLNQKIRMQNMQNVILFPLAIYTEGPPTRISVSSAIIERGSVHFHDGLRCKGEAEDDST
jgi:hypothetical protein